VEEKVEKMAKRNEAKIKENRENSVVGYSQINFQKKEELKKKRESEDY